MRIENKREIYLYINKIVTIIINNNCLYLVYFINMMAFSRRVRVPRII